MAFILYEKQEPQKFVRISDVELGGKLGVLANFVRSRAPSGSETFKWRLCETEILTLLGQTNPDQYVLMLDLKPAQKRKVSLGRVLEIRGVSQPTRTPICVRMEIYLDKEAADISAKETFELEALGTFETALEFLELNGGTRDQRWTWSAMGRLNGPILSPDTLNYFTRPIVTSSAEPEFDRMRLDLEELFSRHVPQPIPTWNIAEQPQQPIPPIENGSRFSRLVSYVRGCATRLISMKGAADDGSPAHSRR